MPYKEIITILRIFTVFQIFLVCGFLVFQSQKNSTKNYLLALIISCKALFLLDALLLSNYRIVFNYASNILMIGTLFQWILGPALYYYTINLTTNQNYSFKRKHLLHLIPFLVNLGFVISTFHIYGYETKLLILQKYLPYPTEWVTFFGWGNFIQIVIYGIFSVHIITRSREEIFRYNSQSVERNLFYLKFFIYDIIVVWSINMLTGYIPEFQIFRIGVRIGTALNIFFIANAIVYQGLRFPQLFHGEPSSRQKYEKNLLTEEEKDRYSKKLLEYMAAQKPYLNPMLSLNDLASQLNMPCYVLSQVLNIVLKQNFYDFINLYRVEESKARLRDASDDRKPILEILFASGFNSKSVFNAAFKKHTGTTPREFKKLLLSESQYDDISSFSKN